MRGFDGDLWGFEFLVVLVGFEQSIAVILMEESQHLAFQLRGLYQALYRRHSFDTPRDVAGRVRSHTAD